MTVAPQAQRIPAKVQGGKTLRDYLSQPSVRESFASVLPKHLTPEKLIKLACVAVSRQPALAECTMESLLKALMTASELGLNPSGVLGEAYLVPYKRNFKTREGKWESVREAQLIPGYRGLIALARRSGNIQSVECHVVFRDDTFEMAFGLNPVLLHKPNFTGTMLDQDILGAYTIAHFKDGGHHIEFMTRSQIESVRKRSKASDDGPWITDYSEMCRKTVIRRAAKYWPLSTEDVMARALEVEARAESGTSDIDLAGSVSARQLDEEAARIASESQQPSRTESMTARIAGDTHVEVDMEESAPAHEPVVGEVIDPKTGEVAAPAPAQDQPQPSQPQAQPAADGAPSIAEQLVVQMADVYGIDTDKAAKALDAYCRKSFKKSTEEVASSPMLTGSLKNYITAKKVPVA